MEVRSTRVTTSHVTVHAQHPISIIVDKSHLIVSHIHRNIETTPSFVSTQVATTTHSYSYWFIAAQCDLFARATAREDIHQIVKVGRKIQ